MCVPLPETLSDEVDSMFFVVLNEPVSDKLDFPPLTRHANMEGHGRAVTFTPARIHVSLSRTRTHAHARARRRLQFMVRDAMCRPLVAEVDIHS